MESFWTYLGGCSMYIYSCKYPCNKGHLTLGMGNLVRMAGASYQRYHRVPFFALRLTHEFLMTEGRRIVRYPLRA
jgi:hypothetical protein